MNSWAMVGGSVTSDGCELVQRAEYTLQCLKILKTHPNNAIRMILDLARIVVSIAVECVDAASEMECFELSS